jgi:hypothetical protein
MSRAIEQLEAMRHLGENWDGYGAAPSRAEAIDLAIEFLHHCQASMAMPEPYVTPTRVGGVLLAWESGPHELEVEFNDPDHGSFVYLNRETGENATGSLASRNTHGMPPLAVTAILSALPTATSV